MRWVKLVGGLCAILIAVIELVEPPLFGGNYDYRRVLNALAFGGIGASYLLEWVGGSGNRRLFLCSTAKKLILGPLIVIVGIAALVSADYPTWFWLPLCALLLGGLWVVDGIQSLRRGKPTSLAEATPGRDDTISLKEVPPK